MTSNEFIHLSTLIINYCSYYKNVLVTITHFLMKYVNLYINESWPHQNQFKTLPELQINLLKMWIWNIMLDNRCLTTPLGCNGQNSTCRKWHRTNEEVSLHVNDKEGWQVIQKPKPESQVLTKEVCITYFLISSKNICHHAQTKFALQIQDFKWH